MHCKKQLITYDTREAANRCGIFNVRPRVRTKLRAVYRCFQTMSKGRGRSIAGQWVSFRRAEFPSSSPLELHNIFRGKLLGTTVVSDSFRSGKGVKLYSPKQLLTVRSETQSAPSVTCMDERTSFIATKDKCEMFHCPGFGWKHHSIAPCVFFNTTFRRVLR